MVLLLPEKSHPLEHGLGASRRCLQPALKGRIFRFQVVQAAHIGERWPPRFDCPKLGLRLQSPAAKGSQFLSEVTDEELQLLEGVDFRTFFV